MAKLRTIVVPFVKAKRQKYMHAHLVAIFVFSLEEVISFSTIACDLYKFMHNNYIFRIIHLL